MTPRHLRGTTAHRPGSARRRCRILRFTRLHILYQIHVADQVADLAGHLDYRPCRRPDPVVVPHAVEFHALMWGVTCAYLIPECLLSTSDDAALATLRHRR